MRGALLTFLVAAAVLALSCTARRTIPTGHYDQYAGPGIYLLSSRHFYFPGADSVEYQFASDDLTSSRYGKGSYRIAGNKLILAFDGTVPPASSVRATTKATAGDSLDLFFRIKVNPRAGEQKPIPGINIAIQNADRKTITGAVSDEDGTARLKLVRNSAAHRVVFGFIGWQSVEHPLDDTDASFDVLLQQYLGEVYPAGKEITFGLAAISDKQLVLKRGKDRIVFVKQ